MDYITLNVRISRDELAAALRDAAQEQGGSPTPPRIVEPAPGGRPLPAPKRIDPMFMLDSTDFRPHHEWGDRSQRNIATVRPELVLVANYIADNMNASLTFGRRSRDLQMQFYEKGTGIHPDRSYHCKVDDDNRAYAIDVNPYPIDYEDLVRYERMGVLGKEAADRFGINLTWGGDWKRYDAAHFQLEAEGYDRDEVHAYATRKAGNS